MTPDHSPERNWNKGWRQTPPLFFSPFSPETDKPHIPDLSSLALATDTKCGSEDEYEALKDEFEYDNELGCPLD
jgi:hypothetical protein